MDTSFATDVGSIVQAPEQAVGEVEAEGELELEDDLISDHDEIHDEGTFMNKLFHHIEEELFSETLTNTYETEEKEDMEVKWWPSAYQLEEMKIPQDANFAVPKPSDWKPVEGKAQICVDRARHEMWMQCKKEIELIRDNFSSMMAETRTSTDAGRSIQQSLFDFLLGPDSEHARAIKKATSIDDPTYCSFLF